MCVLRAPFEWFVLGTSGLFSATVSLISNFPLGSFCRRVFPDSPNSSVHTRAAPSAPPPLWAHWAIAYIVAFRFSRRKWVKESIASAGGNTSKSSCRGKEVRMDT